MKRLARFGLPLRLLAVVGVLIVAWGLRARAVALIPVDYDEDDYLRAAQQYATLFRAGDWAGFTQTNYRFEHPPLAKIAFGLSILPAPETPLIPDRPTSAAPDPSLPHEQLIDARNLAAAFGTLAAALLALVNPLAGLFLAVHTFTIKYTSEVMLEALPALTSLASVLCYVGFKRKPHSSGKVDGWLIASAALLGLTAASKYLYCVVGIAILADWLLSTKRENATGTLPWKTMTAWGVIALAIFFIADPYLWPAPLARLQESLLYHVGYATNAAEVQNANYPAWQPFVWLAQSVEWHPGVFLISIDVLISLLALFGLQRLWRREPVYVLWLGLGMAFLLVWPTKWPQYILTLTAPLSLAAAEGAWLIVVDTPLAWWKQRRAEREKPKRPTVSLRERLQALPWLLPGLAALGVLILFPLLFQLAMSLTDFNGTSIRDGLQGGVWRAVWLGLSGQSPAISFDPFSRSSYGAPLVSYTGPNLLGSMFSGLGADVLVFDVLWTVLSVGLQAVLGISVALLLNRRGVRFAGFWRTVFILPWAIPEFIGALIWLRTFEPSNGWMGMLLPEGARQAYALLSGTNWSLAMLLTAATWYGFPFIMLAASAGLKLIPPEVYEAAAVDGAEGWLLFREVTWPLLLPLAVPALIIRAIFAFNQFYLFYVMQTPFPLTTFANLSYLFFTHGNRYAVSAAINVFTVVVLIGLLLVFNRWSKAAEGVTYA